MIVIKVIKNHLTPLKKSDYTKIHNLRDTLHRPLTATSEQSVFSWQNYEACDLFLMPRLLPPCAICRERRCGFLICGNIRYIRRLKRKGRADK